MSLVLGILQCDISELAAVIIHSALLVLQGCCVFSLQQDRTEQPN